MGRYGGEGTWWDGAWSIGALAVTCTPLVAIPLFAPDAIDLHGLANTSNIVAHVVLLFSVLLLYLHWRLTGGQTGWLVLTLTALSVQGLALATLTVVEGRPPGTALDWIVFLQLVLGLGVFATVALSERVPLRVDPLAVGVGVGLAVGGLRRGLLVLDTVPDLSSAWMSALGGALLLIDLAIAAAIVRLANGPAWLRRRLAGSLLLMCIGHATMYSATGDPVLYVVSIVTYILGAALLLSLTAALARSSWRDNQDALDLLARQLEEAEAEARADQAKLHEIRATVAGLGSASRLVNQRSSVGDARRQQLEDMIGAEMARLQRLLHDGQQDRCDVDLDATISPIVLRHRARGYPIDWRPTGDHAIARADDVAEVINVLLENAYQHAPHGSVSISTRRTADVVEIAVSDTGPGIDLSVRSRIFEWGGRGRASRGSGIGLNVAYKLTTALGGYLKLVDSPLPGTTFVLGLPAEEIS